MGVAWKGDIPLSLNNRLAVHVAILGTMELDASDNGKLGRSLGGVGISWTRVRVSNCAVSREMVAGLTREFDELAAILDNSKLDAVDVDLVDGH